jgi:hypothetical protein
VQAGVAPCAPRYAFGRDGRGESISVDHASAAIAHDAVATPNFPINDMGNTGTLDLRGLETTPRKCRL